MTTIEAKRKLCPLNDWKACQADACMFWRWTWVHGATSQQSDVDGYCGAGRAP